jgi:O-antigen/teichoic acid export membrane protein
MAAAANLFVAVPFVLHALGPEQFGAWATLVSLVTFAGFLDFGFGNGTMNLVAAAHGRGAREEVAEVVVEGRNTLVRVSLVLGALVLVALPVVPWHLLLGLPPEMAGISRAAAASVLFTIVLAVPLNLATRVQLGLGRGDRAFRWQFAGQLLTLALVILLARSRASLAVLTAAAVATPLIASVANTVFLWRSRDIAKRTPNSRRPDIAQRIRHEGLLFFVLQLAAALSFSADLPLISALLGPAEAGKYAIVQRLFSIVPLALGLIWAPLWPIYRQALSAGNHQWVATTLRRSMVFAVVVAAGCVCVFTFAFEPIVSLWIRRPLGVGTLLLIGFGTWCVIEAAGTALATFLNAASVMRYQVIVATIFAFTCLAAKVWAIRHFGIVMVPWATAVVYGLTVLLPAAYFGPRLFNDAFARRY